MLCRHTRGTTVVRGQQSAHQSSKTTKKKQASIWPGNAGRIRKAKKQAKHWPIYAWNLHPHAHDNIQIGSLLTDICNNIWYVLPNIASTNIYSLLTQRIRAYISGPSYHHAIAPHDTNIYNCITPVTFIPT